MTEKRDGPDLTNESDRGCVLVAAAMLEESLEKRFCSVFESNRVSKSIQTDLFGAHGPLSGFSGKMKLAYAIGLIPKAVFLDLDAVRKLRNEAAHTSDDFDFMDESIGKRVEALRCVQEFVDASPRYRIRGRRRAAAEPRPANPGREQTLQEAQSRLDGFIKYRKSLFALGVHSLRNEVKTGLTLEELRSLVDKLDRTTDATKQAGKSKKKASKRGRRTKSPKKNKGG